MIEVLLASAATFGWSWLIVYKDGFLDIFLKLRSKSWLKMLLCFKCASVWIAMPLSALFGLSILEYFAVVGFVILADELV